MITLTKITNSEIFTFMIALDFKLFSRIKFCLETEKTIKLLKSKLLFKKITHFTGQLLQNYK